MAIQTDDGKFKFGSMYKVKKYNESHPFTPPTPTAAAYVKDLAPGTDVENKYVTPLSEEEEHNFQKWVAKNKIPWRDEPTADYDMRGFWKAQQSGDPNAVRSEENLHFPDTWKTPTHETFSNESMSSNEETNPDNRHWEGDRLVHGSGTVLKDETPTPACTRTIR
jgi:hypothetical protein